MDLRETACQCIRFQSIIRNALDVRKMLHTYEEAGYGIQAAEVAVSLQTYHKYSFACHQDGEKLLQYYYEASKK